MQVQPYLFFEGRCEEALDFYQSALGAEVTMLMRIKESPEPTSHKLPPNSGDKIMHTSFRIGEAVLMGSDGLCSGKPNFQGFSLSLNVPDEATADQFFAALAKDGTVQMPLTKTFYSPRFGMVTDKFGVMWMINVTP